MLLGGGTRPPCHDEALGFDGCVTAAGLPEIVSHLRLWRRAERLGQPYRHLDRDFRVCPLNISHNAFRVTINLSAPRDTVNPKGSRHRRDTMPPGRDGSRIVMIGCFLQ